MPWKDREYHKAYYRRYAANKRQRVIEYKESNPCMDCGKFYPYYVMDLDHREGEVKILSVSKMDTYSWEKVKAELKKCDLVCANCHRIRTFNRAALSQLAEEADLNPA